MQTIEKLAIEDGPKIIKEEFSRKWPGIHWIGDEERGLVLETLKGTAFNDTLREDLCDFYGCQRAISTNSGTSALFLATPAGGIVNAMREAIIYMKRTDLRTLFFC